MTTLTTPQAFAETRRLQATWQAATRLWMQQPNDTTLALKEEAHAAYEAEQQRALRAAGAPKLPTTPYGTRLGFTSRQQYLRFVASQPRLLPAMPKPRPLSRTQLLLCCLLWLALAPLLLLAFVLLGERPRLKA